MLAPLLALAASAAPVCTWDDAPWLRWAELRPEGGGAPVAAIRGGTGVGFTGELGEEGGRVRMAGALRGHGVEVHGELGPVDRLFHADAVVPLPGGGGVPAGADVAIAGFEGGLPVAVATGLDGWFAPRARLGAPVPCSALDVRAGLGPLDAREALAAVGVPPVEPVLADLRGERLRPEPGALPLGRFTARGPQTVWPLEERGPWTRLAAAQWGGAVLVGWVRGLDVREPEPGTTGTSSLFGVLDPGEPFDAVRCGDPLPLWSIVRGRAAEIGRIDAGIALRLGERRGELVEATLVDAGWLHPAEGGALAVPAVALGCPVERRGPPPNPFAF